MATRTVYQMGVDGTYSGPATAYESPLEPGVFLLPSGCIEPVPPAFEAGQVAVWLAGVWTIVSDHRGETWFDGKKPVIVDFVGDPAERGFSPIPPPRSIDDLLAAKIAAIVAAADALLSAGAPVDTGLHIALDNGGRVDLTAMAATATAATSGAVPWPESYARGWITVENVRIPLPTPATGLALAARVGDYYAALIQHRRDLKDAALSAEDAAALEAIDIAAGWPA